MTTTTNFFRRIRSIALFGLAVVSLIDCSMSWANDNEAIRKLKEVEQKVSSVVGRTMNTLVAVTDGEGSGSGVIISADGLVLTAGHVMASPDQGQYEVVLPSGRRVKAKSLGKNLNTDSGMIQILEPGPYAFVELNREPRQKLGTWVVSLGHSGGWELGRKAPVRTGRVLAQIRHQILTDAVLIGGDSGGPLFNLEGELIGIHSSIGDSIAENRHVSIPTFLRDWDRLRRGESWGSLPELNEPDKKTKRGRIGVRVDKAADRCLLKSVEDGGSARDIGIRAGDIVASFDNVVIDNGQHLIDFIKQKHAGEVFPMTIERNGQSIEFEIILR